MDDTRIVRAAEGVRVLDPRTGRPLPRENAPAATSKGEAAELEGVRGVTVPWVSYWIRRFEAGEIELLDQGRWVVVEHAGAERKVVPARTEKPAAPAKRATKGEG